MCDILEKKNLVKIPQPRKRIENSAVCCVCGCNSSEIKLRRFNEYIVCKKHYDQLEKYGQIIDSTPRVHKKPIEICCICGGRKDGEFKNKPYCTKHLLQMQRHGKILERTIYDSNEYILYDDFAEVIMYDKDGNKSGVTKVDLDVVEDLKQFKIYSKMHGTKQYATINMPDGRKVRLNRYLMGLTNTDIYTTEQVVDHINGDSMDNRKSNLRICTQKQNSQNNRKPGVFTGVNYNKQNGKWVARISHNYKSKQLGTFKTQAEALLCRIKAEKEIIGNFGPNKEYYYLIDHPSPIEEANKLISDGA